MFVNKVNIKDLFSANPGPLSGNKHGDNSQNNSQFAYSQVDFPDSQDMPNSQQCSSSGISQHSESPGKRFYQRYMSKATIFHKDLQDSKGSSIPAKKLSYQQQLQNNKARAKERDERDLLGCILSTVKQYASEVNTAVAAITECMHDSANTSQQQLAQHLQEIKSGMDKHNEEIFKTFHLRENVKEQVAEMRAELSAKTTRITMLEQQLEQAHSSDTVMEQMERVCTEQTKQTTDDIQQMYASQQQAFNKHAERHNQHYVQLMQQTQNCQRNFAQSHSSVISDIKQRFDDLDKGKKQQRQDYEHLEEGINENMRQLQQQHKREMKHLLQQQVHILQGQSEEQHKQLQQQQQQQLHDLQLKHGQHLQNFVQQQHAMLQADLSSHQHELKDVVQSLQKSSVENATITQQDKLNCSQEKENRYELQLMRDRHETEVASLKEQLQPAVHTATCIQRASQQNNHYMCPNGANLVSTHHFQTRTQNSVPLFESNRGDGSLQNFTSNSINHHGKAMRSNKLESANAKPQVNNTVGRKQDFISPLIGARAWNSRSLFAKTSPSPVATVLPQRQQQQQAKVASPDNSPLVSKEQVSKPDVGSKTVKKRRRRRPCYKPRRRPKKQKLVDVTADVDNLDDAYQFENTEEWQDEFADDFDKLAGQSVHQNKAIARTGTINNSIFVIKRNSDESSSDDDSSDGSCPFSITAELLIKRSFKRTQPALLSSFRGNSEVIGNYDANDLLCSLSSDITSANKDIQLYNTTEDGRTLRSRKSHRK